MANTDDAQAKGLGDPSFPFESYAAIDGPSPQSPEAAARAEQIEKVRAYAQAKAQALANEQASAGEQPAPSIPVSPSAFVQHEQASAAEQSASGAPVPPASFVPSEQPKAVQGVPEDNRNSFNEQLTQIQLPVPPAAASRQASPQPDSSAASTVRPVSLGAKAPDYSVPNSAVTQDDVEAVSAYKTLEARRKRKRRTRIIVGCLLGALALGGAGFWVMNNMAAQETSEDLPAFDLGYAVVDTYETSVSASGAIKPVSQVIVNPEVGGTITEVRVAEGDKVSKGDILFQLKNDDLDKAIEDAEKKLRTAESNVTTAQDSVDAAYNRLVVATTNYDTVFATSYETQEIADAAGAEATETLNTARVGYDEAQSSLVTAQDAVTTAQEELDKAREDSRKRTVLAPESGAIVALNAEVGAAVGDAKSTVEGKPLVSIADLSTLRVVVQVNEIDINFLKEGQLAEVTFSALPDLTLEAVVEHIAATSNSSGEDVAGGIVTYEVALLIEEPDEQVKPGMTARVKILTEKIEDALTVPVASLEMIDDTQALVYVAPGYAGEEEPSFEERTVKVVTKDSVTAVIEGNLRDGDAVRVFYDASATDAVSGDESMGY